MSFRGHFKQNLDAKNRLSVPARFRASFSDGIVLARQLDPCIGIWTPTAFDEFVQGFLAETKPLSRRRREQTRYFTHFSFDVELDAAGRVTIPQELLDKAGIEREVVVAGTPECLEVWARDRWLEDQETLEERVGIHVDGGEE